MKDSIKAEYEAYNKWCKEHNTKPCYATSLEAYMKEQKTTKK